MKILRYDIWTACILKLKKLGVDKLYKRVGKLGAQALEQDGEEAQAFQNWGAWHQIIPLYLLVDIFCFHATNSASKCLLLRPCVYEPGLSVIEQFYSIILYV